MKRSHLAGALSLATALVVLTASATAATSSPPVRNAGRTSPPAASTLALTTLYRQSSSGTSGGVYSNSGNAVQGSSWDSQAADDFVVPAGERWSVTEVDAPGLSTCTQFGDVVTVFMYRDAAGLPATQVYSGSASAATGLLQNDCSFSIPVSVTLTPGHYWLSVQPNDPLNWYWEIRFPVSNHGAVWRNPGGGLGRCPTWTDFSQCVWETSTDLVFTLLGARSTDYAGTPGQPNCHAKTVSALSKQYGGVAAAARSLSFPTVETLQKDIRAYCGN
jgi:hypothetical protein